MQKVIMLKDGPHRIGPLGYWGIAYAQKLLQLNGAWTPAANNVALLAAMLSEAEESGPDFEPVKQWGFAETAVLIPPSKHVAIEALLDELFKASFIDEGAAPDDEPEGASDVPPTPQPGGAKPSRSRRSPASASPKSGE